MEKKFNFTINQLNTLPEVKKGSRVTYHDTKVSGLSIRVTSTGSKSFIVRRFVNNKAVRTTLGRFPDMTISQARLAAREALNMFSSGENPNTEKTAKRLRTTTLQKAMDDYIESRKHALKDKTIRDYRIIYNSYLSEWSNKELMSITRAMVVKKHTAIGKKNHISS
jgi:hypothetical protein